MARWRLVWLGWPADCPGLTLRRECKSQFRNSQAGSCRYCGRNIIHDMVCLQLLSGLGIVVVVSSVVVYSVERGPSGLHRSHSRATPRGYLSQNCQSGEVVPSVHCYAISVEYGTEDECVGHAVQITFIFIDFRVCDFAFAFKMQNAPCVSRFKRVLFSDRFQFAF